MRRSTMMTTAGLVAALLALAGAAACGRQNERPTYPDGAIRLRQNVPTPVGERRVVAFNIDGDTAVVSVTSANAPATTVSVTEGKRFDAAGLAFDVIDIVPATNDDPTPGSADGIVVIVVVSSTVPTATGT
jgi:hypothetical protein